MLLIIAILSNQHAIQIFLKKQNNQGMAQKELIKWWATISRTLKCSSEYLHNETNLLQNPLRKKFRNVKYPELELAHMNGQKWHSSR